MPDPTCDGQAHFAHRRRLAALLQVAHCRKISAIVQSRHLLPPRQCFSYMTYAFARLWLKILFDVATSPERYTARPRLWLVAR